MNLEAIVTNINTPQQFTMKNNGVVQATTRNSRFVLFYMTAFSALVTYMYSVALKGNNFSFSNDWEEYGEFGPSTEQLARARRLGIEARVRAMFSFGDERVFWHRPSIVAAHSSRHSSLTSRPSIPFDFFRPLAAQLLATTKEAWPECHAQAMTAIACKEFIDEEILTIFTEQDKFIRTRIIGKRSTQDEWYNAVTILMDDNDVVLGRDGDGMVYYGL